MTLTRQVRIQLAVFAIVAIVAGATIVFGYIKAPALLFGIGRYTVIVQLPEAAGLYHAETSLTAAPQWALSRA